MKITFAVLSLALAAFLGPQGAFAANLVTNGGFETGDFTGWTLSGPVTTSNNPADFYGVDGLDAYSGSYGAYLSTEPGQSPLVLSQTVTVAPGSSYVLGFDLQNDGGALPGFGNSFSVTLNGATVYSISNSAAFTYGPFNTPYFVSAHAPVSEVLAILSTNTAAYWSLDNVSLVAAPEPATWLLVVPAALGMLILRRRIAN
jgi:hypothetical protein